MSSSTPVPFSEAPWLSGFPSPYYNDSHRRWQKACRAFITENLTKHALEWERAELVPAEVYQTFAKANMLIPALPAPLPVEWLKKLGVTEMLGGISIDEWDYTHTAIYVSEVHTSSEFWINRCKRRGLMAARFRCTDQVSPALQDH